MICQTHLAILICLPCSAQDAWTCGYNLGGGPTTGGLKQLSQKAGYTFGASIEAVKTVSKSSALVGSVGDQWFPGNNQLLSFIPKPAAATGVNPTIYETRTWKVDARGFQRALPYLATEKNGGSQVVTNGNPIADMGLVPVQVLTK